MRPGRSPFSLGTLGATVLTAGAVVACIGTLVPWVASGTRRRNSYDIVDLVERLGFAPDGPVGVGLRAWPLVPLLLVIAAALAWWGRRALAALVGALAALYAGGVGAAVWRAPREGIVHVLDGPLLTLIGGGLVLAGSLLTAFTALAARRTSNPS